MRATTTAPSASRTALATTTLGGGAADTTTLTIFAEPSIAAVSPNRAPYELPIGERSLDLQLNAINGVCEDEYEWGLGPCNEPPLAFLVSIENGTEENSYKLNTTESFFNTTGSSLIPPHGTTPWYGADRFNWKHHFRGVKPECDTTRVWAIWIGPNSEVWLHL